MVRYGRGAIPPIAPPQLYVRRSHYPATTFCVGVTLIASLP
jgi:hypothetical protein